MQRIEQSLSLGLAMPRLLLLAAALTLVTAGARAQHVTYLHAFQCEPDGDEPTGSLTLDAAGNLYGTTWGGGTDNAGTVFKVSPQGEETILHSFALGGTDGANPSGVTLVFDAAGNLYGVTGEGGNQNYNNGTVFKLAPDGTETILHVFTTDGFFPFGLSIDQEGNLYGTTWRGGAYDDGTVFKVTPTETETLYNFRGSPGPFSAVSGVVVDPEGNLYGTSEYGGTEDGGTVFELNASGQETVLLNIDGSLGLYPEWGLFRSAGGRLYGTSYEGVGFQGAVWRVAGQGKSTLLHQFEGAPDGGGPVGTLAEDSSGNLYGTTAKGGTGPCKWGCGTIYEISAAGVESVSYSFSDTDGGYNPQGGLILDSEGNLYGTTAEGGDGKNCGTVFKFTP